MSETYQKIERLRREIAKCARDVRLTWKSEADRQIVINRRDALTRELSDLVGKYAEEQQGARV